MKTASKGNSTRSSHPTQAERPSAANNTTRAGVKQHTAVMTAPTAPPVNSFGLMRIGPLALNSTSYTCIGASVKTIHAGATLTSCILWMWAFPRRAANGFLLEEDDG